MEAMFVIPTLISPECPYKLVPALCKLIERNTLVTYSSILRQAAILRFAGPNKGLLSDSCSVTDRMSDIISLLEADDPPERPSLPKYPNPSVVGGSSSEGDRWTGDTKTRDKDAIETPRGISFYSTISLEPTFLDIPLEGRPSAESTEKVSRVIRIGMKCVPYKLDGVTNLLDAMSMVANRNKIQTLISRKMMYIRKLLGVKYKDYEKELIQQSVHRIPLNTQLLNVKFLSKHLGGGSTPYNWSLLTIFTAQDFKDKSLKEILFTYRDLAKGGWGDMVVIDDVKDVISFCTQRTLACTQLHLDYLRDILNLDNVIDSDLFKKTSSGPMFSSKKVSISKIFESTCVPCLYTNHIIE